MLGVIDMLPLLMVFMVSAEYMYVETHPTGYLNCIVYYVSILSQ